MNDVERFDEFYNKILFFLGIPEIRANPKLFTIFDDFIKYYEFSIQPLLNDIENMEDFEEVIDELKYENSELTNLNQELEEDIDDLGYANEGLREEIEELEDSNTRLQEEIKELKLRLDD